MYATRRASSLHLIDQLSLSHKKDPLRREKHRAEEREREREREKRANEKLRGGWGVV
jgi:hypothetical protein